MITIVWISFSRRIFLFKNSHAKYGTENNSKDGRSSSRISRKSHQHCKYIYKIPPCLLKFTSFRVATTHSLENSEKQDEFFRVSAGTRNLSARTFRSRAALKLDRGRRVVRRAASFRRDARNVAGGVVPSRRRSPRIYLTRVSKHVTRKLSQYTRTANSRPRKRSCQRRKPTHTHTHTRTHVLRLLVLLLLRFVASVSASSDGSVGPPLRFLSRTMDLIPTECRVATAPTS